MSTSSMKRLLSLILVLAMVVSVVPFPTFAVEQAQISDSQEIVAAEEEATEAAQQIQSKIDEMLNWYLGSTQTTREEIDVIVSQMDSDNRWMAQVEIYDLEVEIGETLTEAEAEALIAANEVLCVFAEILGTYSAGPNLLAEETVLDGQIKVYSNLGSISVNGTTVTITNTISGFSLGTNYTFTITNTSGKAGTLQFDYNGNTFDTFGLDTKTGTYPATLLQNDETITITAKSKCGFGGQNDKLILSNLVFTPQQDSYKTEFVFDASLGSMTVDGNAVSSGDKQAIAKAGAKLVASGSSFIGWINDSTGQVLSTASEYTYVPTEAITVRPVFAGSNAWFQTTKTEGSYLYEDLNAASASAAGASNKTVVLTSNGTLPAGDYTIPAGVTLLIPCDAANTLYTTTPQTLKIEKYAATPTAYRTLTMASGAKLTVNGAMSISGSMATNTPSPGAVYGAVGFVKMQEGASITVNNGANLYVWGFITGSGSVTIENGGTVYEAFQVTDFRGGNNTSGIVSDVDKYHAFPFNQYYIQNVEVPMTLKAGAVENGYMAVFITLVNIQGSAVPFIGPNGMFNVTEGYIVKDYIESTDRLEISVYGKLQMKSLSISMNLGLAGYKTINSQNFDLPVTNNVTVHVYEGSHMDITQDISFLPGTELIVEKGATGTLDSGNRIIIYDADEWTGKSYAHYGAGADIEPIKYAPGKTLVGKRNVNVDAKVVLGGTIDMDAGAVYATAGGANVAGLEGAVVTMKLPTSTRKAYQIVQTDGWVAEEVPLTSVPLKNADGTTLIANLPDGVYTYANGTWTGECLHILKEAVTTQPTCSTPGVKTFSCACGYSYTEEIATVAHVETDVPAKDATCSAPGLTAGVQCTVCGQFVVAQEEIPALPHTEVIDEAVAATCTTTGLTEGKHCSVCNEVIAEQTETPALGHEYKKEYVDAVDGKAGYVLCSCIRCDDEVISYTYGAKNGEEKYTTLQEALDAYESGIIQLQADTDSVTVTKDVVVDLNGFNIASVTATAAELTILDTKTEDYSVADGDYGEIAAISGTVIPAEGYIAITEAEGTSYHKISLEITDMALRSADVGVYYNCIFSGDEMVASQVTTYGVALSVRGIPAVGNADSKYSVFHKFESGSNTPSTLLKNVMKETNSASYNNRCANLQVYGRAYIQIGDTYIYGETVSRSFREQVELVDEAWNTLTAEQQFEVLTMYRTFQDDMADWIIPNIKGNI